MLGLTQEDERMPKGPSSGGAGTTLDEMELINVDGLPREVWDWCERQLGPPTLRVLGACNTLCTPHHPSQPLAFGGLQWCGATTMVEGGGINTSRLQH